MLPGIGFVFDGINAAWYAQEGDYYNAACSLVSALTLLSAAVAQADPIAMPTSTLLIAHGTPSLRDTQVAYPQ